MNRKGFVLIETLVVTIFTMFIFSVLYNTVVPLLGKYKELSYYNDLDTTYDLYYLKKMVISDTNFSSIKGREYKKITCSNINDSNCESLYSFLGIDNQDEVYYINTTDFTNILEDEDVSIDTRTYLKYLDSKSSEFLLLQNDGYLSYLEIKEYETISEKIEGAIEVNTNATCNPIVEEDGIIYFSGTNDCVDFNYVWYSGKLWRVTAIYPDGSMKMTTEDIMTSISYDEELRIDLDYYDTEASYTYQWLNQEFLPTLHNYQNIVVSDAKWNTSVITEGRADDAIGKKLEQDSMITSAIGFLDIYEYYLSYLNAPSYSNGYLNIGYNWWLFNYYYGSSTPLANNNGFSATPLSVRPIVWMGSGIWAVDERGYSYIFFGHRFSVRPSIVLKSNNKVVSGTGSKTNPYRLKGDKEEIQPNTTLLNTRSSGEYLEFDGEKYRIVEVENGITKINKVDYVRDDSGTILTKNFASTATYGLDTNTKNDNYWDYYLNNTWYNNITTEYKNMMVEGVYYLGSTYYGYKSSICQEEDSLNSTKDCEKTTKTWSGYVGLPRIGEMFSSQLGRGVSYSEDMWLITSSGKSKINTISSNGSVEENEFEINTSAVRPSINLNSSVVIKSGSGTEGNPFIIELPN